MSANPRFADNVASARAAGLRYVSDHEPGFTRERRGSAFVYKDAKGRVVRNAKVLDRFRSLVIPPAWTNVWICSHAEGHIQVTGVMPAEGSNAGITQNGMRRATAANTTG